MSAVADPLTASFAPRDVSFNQPLIFTFEQLARELTAPARPSAGWLVTVLRTLFAPPPQHWRADIMLLLAEAAEEALSDGELEPAMRADLAGLAAVARAAVGDLTPWHLAIARELARDADQVWDKLPPPQQEADLTYAEWMLRIINAAARTLVQA